MTEPSAALAELTEISSQIESAVLFDADGKVVAATVPEDRAERVATSAKALLEQAGQIGEGELTQIEASTGDGSLFVVRDGADDDRRLDLRRAHGRARLLRPEELSAGRRRAACKAGRETEAEAKPKAKPKPRTTRPKSNGTP